MSTDVQTRTSQIVRDNLARIRLLAVRGSLLTRPAERERVERVLHKYDAWGLPSPSVMVAAGNAAERQAAKQRGWETVSPEGKTTALGAAIDFYQKRFGRDGDPKRHIVEFARRGGRGKANFIEPFTGGAGTTCGAWTPIVDHDTQGRPIRGFMKAVLANGFCPVACPFCYLQTYQLDAMTLYLNWDDLATQLREEWFGYDFPLNFSEVGGFVEYDRWFAAEDGEGSMVQFAIDVCAASETIPFFLTKIAYPRYLKFNGHVQVGISLMPEAIRQDHAPHGSPSDELLESLAWAWQAGAYDPTIRLFLLWERRALYPALLKRCRDLLGERDWRITLDIPRFTPSTAHRIAKRRPESAEVYAGELDPTGQRDLQQLARDGWADKKVRPPVARQVDMYRWVREQLDALGCDRVSLTACKAEPDELAALVQEGVIHKMPCACHKARGVTQLVQLEG